jgi:FHS family L-fucose permease-like MFS transporter
MASGITMLQVAANPLIAILGKPSASHFRLVLAQSFNSLGTFLGPLLGAAIILSAGIATPDPATTPPDVMAAFRAAEVHAVQAPFLGIALGILALACVFWIFRKNPSVPTPAPSEANLRSLRLLAQPRQGLGVLAIFLYVGAEVTIGSLMINYLIRPSALGISAQAAGQMVALYWGGAMVGRLIGSLLLFIKTPATRLLTACGLFAMALVLFSSFVSGEIGSYALIAVGLFNSIMFPTIFTLTIQGMGEKTPQVSGLLCMAIVGGAIVPLITGAIADRIGLDLALLVPAACYLLIAGYGQFARSSEPALSEEDSERQERAFSHP